jgi:anthranilate synthase component II
MRLLIVDNYDSFTYNLYRLFNEIGCRNIKVIINDKIKIEMVAKFDKIVFSPGPGIPSQFPILSEILYAYQKTKSILGVCLGHQSIGCFYGATLENLQQPYHGISSLLQITHNSEKLFHGLNHNINVGRYHSWIIQEESIPTCLAVTSKSEDGCIMSIAHKKYDIKGVQFHPESFITSYGHKLMQNWLKT